MRPTPAQPAGAAVVAEAKQVVHEVGIGRLGTTSHRWLGWVSMIALALFAVDTALVMNGTLQHGFDEPVERAVQRMPWGPLTYVMDLTNATSGFTQELAGVVVVIALFLFERRAGMLMALGSLGSLIDQFAKVSIARHRPSTDIVAIVNSNGGFSYPSGHAVFFTWLYFMLAMSLAPKLSSRWRPLLWALVGTLISLACLGRVWAGAHWPTDVIGGFLLGVGWCAFVLWLPERWLPSPTWRAPWKRPGGQC